MSSFKKIEDEIKAEANKTLQSVKTIGEASEREAHETYLAAEILRSLLENKEVSKDQIKFLKEQSIDLAKALTLIGLQAVPGSSLAIIVLEKIAEKHGFTLFPQAQKEPKGQ
jgi:hypothetical protein